MNEPENLWVVTVTTDTLDPRWAQATTVVGTREILTKLLGDLDSLPPGVKLLKGNAAKRFLRQAVRHEKRFQEDLKFRKQGGGRN
jgi:hypothetical protein